METQYYENRAIFSAATFLLYYCQKAGGFDNGKFVMRLLSVCMSEEGT